ncbi:MAG TPA: metal-dependent hydrolase [Methanoregula sp.]|nr:metal-dependent hydrolase [Methanoregula sp.]
MYFFFHLLTGLILGLILADLLRDRRWILPCALGSILPDLIDKPLGHLLLAQSLGYGRIYAHTLLFFILLILAGITLWKYKKSVFCMGLAAGVLSHEVLDQMWNLPKNWYWPLLGPFQGRLREDYWLVLIQRELENPVEAGIAISLCAGAALYLFSRERIMKSDTGRAMVKSALLLAAIALLIFSGIVLGTALTGEPLKVPGMTGTGDAVLGGMVLALASFLLWRYYDRIPAGPGVKANRGQKRRP